MKIKLELTAQERLVLDRLAESDLRRPSEQLRWLVMQEARRRGLAAPPTNATNPAGELFQGKPTGFAQCNP